MSRTGLTLEKGGHLTLEKGMVDDITFGLGWEPHPNARTNVEVDPDASAFGLCGDGQVRNNDWFIYYNQKRSPDGDSHNPASIIHMGDDRGGGKEIAELANVEDSEQIRFTLSRIPEFVTSIPLCVTIDKAQARQHHFGMLQRCYIRVFRTSDGEELGRYDLTEDAAGGDTMVFGQLTRSSSGWIFEATSESFSGNLAGLCKRYGVDI
jgi:tellurium resistance protein TerD